LVRGFKFDVFVEVKILHFCGMTLEAFISSLSQSHPPEGLSKLLQALWHEGKNDWEKAHNIAQDISSSDGSWIHAYLHRVEGDHANAAYWYHRAGKTIPRVSLEEEWEGIARELLGGGSIEDVEAGK
jgi:hypothetical protein